MKKRTIAILVALMLLAGCQTLPSAAPSQEDTPNMEEIIQQSVDEAVQEKMSEYQEELEKKDQEIATLKEQLEELSKQQEPPAESDEGKASPVPESRPEETPPELEIPFQPDPKPAPSQSSTVSASYDPYDLKNMYPGFVWEGIEEAEEESYTAGCLLEEAAEAVHLINEEREAYGLATLAIDENLMELAETRAEEMRTSYSHTRPDGTSVMDLHYGENGGRKTSPEEQVNSWMNSEGHRKNILAEKYHHIGVGCYQAENGNIYWAAVFSLD